MKDSNQIPDEKIIGNMWSLLFTAIYSLLFLVILLLGYFLLETDINAFFNEKKYTKEELEDIDKKAMINLSLENEIKNWDRIEGGIHVRTGLHDDPNLNLIVGTCTSCHSAQLITQNRATRAGWKSMIKWMQKTQGLPELGKSEPKILDYLAKYYAPQETGRRKNIDLDKIKWYVLNLEES